MNSKQLLLYILSLSLTVGSVYVQLWKVCGMIVHENLSWRWYRYLYHQPFWNNHLKTIWIWYKPGCSHAFHDLCSCYMGFFSSQIYFQAVALKICSPLHCSGNRAWNYFSLRCLPPSFSILKIFLIHRKWRGCLFHEDCEQQALYSKWVHFLKWKIFFELFPSKAG